MTLPTFTVGEDLAASDLQALADAIQDISDLNITSATDLTALITNGTDTTTFTAVKVYGWLTAGLITIYGQSTAGGSTLTAGSNGNVSNTTVLTLPSGWRPPSVTGLTVSWPCILHDSTNASDGQWNGLISTTGGVSIRSGAPTAAIASGDTLHYLFQFPGFS